MCRCGGRIMGRRIPRPHPTPIAVPVPKPVQETFPLPLKAVNVEAKIADFCASVTIRQKFVNAESDPIEAVYQFTLGEKATVSDFVAIIDGNKVKGVIQEKEQAKDTYDDAIASGHGAYMMEEKEEEPNVFTVNVGNLPPGKEADIAITYVTELQFEDGQLKFSLPSNNNDHATYKSGSLPQLQFRAHFSMTSNIRSLSSPSHPITFEFGEEPNQATVTLSSESPQASAAKDFIIFTKLAQPHQPCGRVEADEKGHRIVMASIYPQLDLADDEDVYSELVFIVDRSGSMSGSRINQVKDTLQIFLRSLGEGTMFNIIGFGSCTEHLFKDGSVEYNDKNLDIATKHVQGMSANLGGTNILRPLEEVLKSKPKEGYPRQLFVLTDGEVGNTQECIDFVRKHADTTRVFTFGIGNEASQDLVKGMAKAGEGFFEFIRTGEPMEEKVMRQLRRAMQPALTDIKVTWKGVSADKVQPAPYRFAPLFSGGRLVVYGILDKDVDGEVEVLVEAKTAVRPYEKTIKVDTSKATPGDLFLKLAAKTLLKDLEEGRSYIHTETGSVKPGKDIVAEAVRISLDSGILCKHTAFVAVEERDEATEGTMKVRKITFEKATPALSAPARHSITSLSPNRVGAGRGWSARGGGGAPAPAMARSRKLSAAPEKKDKKKREDCKEKEGGAGKGFFSLAKSKKSHSPVPVAKPASALVSNFSAGAEKRHGSRSKSTEASASFDLCQAEASAVPILDSFSLSNSYDNDESEEELVKEEKKSSAPAPAQMREIIMKQKASGCWEWADAVALLGLSADKLRSGIPSASLTSVDKDVEAVWATAVVAAFLKKNFADQENNWDLVVKKAAKFIARQKKSIKLKNADEDLKWLDLAAAFLSA